MTEKRSRPAGKSTLEKTNKNGAATVSRARHNAARPARHAKKTAATRKAASASPPKGRPAKRRELRDVVVGALEELKALDIRALDVRGLTDITDTMVVASGTSDRHVRSIADRVLQRCKEAGFKAYGVEGERDGEWLLVDLHDVVLHVMLPRVREFYALEKLWTANEAAA
jgi:ribosome-associated protein